MGHTSLFLLSLILYCLALFFLKTSHFEYLNKVTLEMQILFSPKYFLLLICRFAVIFSFFFFFFKWHFHTICYRDCIHFPVWSLKSLLHSLCSYSVTGQGCSQIAKFGSNFLHWAFPWCFQFLIKFIHSGFLFVCFEVFVLLFYQFNSYFSGDSFLWAFSSAISMIPLSTQQFGRNMLVVMGLVMRKLNNSIHFLLAVFVMNS